MTDQGYRVPTFDVHDRLSKARRDAGIKQERMAELLGCSRRTIVRWETKGPVPRSVILGYHVATMTSLEWLENGTPEDPTPGGTESHLWESNPRPIHYKSGKRHPFGVIIPLPKAA